MSKTWAILPIKHFARAKTRLRPVLSRSECTSVARTMAIDMLHLLSSVEELDRIMVVGGSSDQVRLARMHGCDYVDDDPTLDISQNLMRVCRLPHIATATRLLYVPADLPLLTVRDVTRLLARRNGGLTICRAMRDGGTNAMLAAPACRMSFSLGSNSAQRHALAATAENSPSEVLDDIAFQRDIDVPEDLAWLCRYGNNGKTVEYLRESKLDSRIMQLFPESLAS
jgi:2-phospho-L-lactate/phosphoenolpyruvate guanylyltransferase